MTFSRSSNNNNNNNNEDDNEDDNIGFSSSTATKQPTIPPELSKQLLKSYFPGRGGGCDNNDDHNTATAKRIPAETSKAVSELLRLFVIEAHSRACLEAECDMEGAMDENTTSGDNNNTNPDTTNGFVPIRGDHITKIAAELLMDFS